MAVTSQNGWSAPGRSVIATYTVPGTTLRIPLRKGDASVVLLDFLARYHREVESLYHNPQDLWGYADRVIRGSSSTVSNHASGTAVDHRAVDHPLGARGTFTAREEAALDRLLGSYDGVIRHGKDYAGRADPMHAELVGSAAAVKRVADRIRSGARPSAPVAPAPAVLRRGDTGPAVSDLQRELGVVVDGDFGPATEAAVRAFQRSRGLAPDGVVGSITAAALASRTPPSARPPVPPSEEDPFMALTDADQALLVEAARSVLWGKAGERSAGPMALTVSGISHDVAGLAAKVDDLARKPAAQVDVAAVVDAITRAGLAPAIADELARRLAA